MSLGRFPRGRVGRRGVRGTRSVRRIHKMLGRVGGNGKDSKSKTYRISRNRLELPAADEHPEVVHRRAGVEPDGPERVQRTRDARAVAREEVKRAVAERDVRRALARLQVRVHAEPARPRLGRARVVREVRRRGEEAPFWLR